MPIAVTANSLQHWPSPSKRQPVSHTVRDPQHAYWNVGITTAKISHLKYSDHLKACKLPTLHYRRMRGDMIETYKILVSECVGFNLSLIHI